MIAQTKNRRSTNRESSVTKECGGAKATEQGTKNGKEGEGAANCSRNAGEKRKWEKAPTRLVTEY